MRNLYLATALSAVALVSTPAAAAPFSGPRAELRGGYDRTTLDLDYDDGVDVFSDSGHKSGFDIGAEVGYDAQIGGAVIAGAYAGAEWATTKECGELVGDDEACLKLGRNFTLGARLGAMISPMAMLYAKAGYSNGQIKATYRNSIDPTLNFSDHDNRDGFHFGIGGEVAIGTQAYARAEYVRTNYSAYTYSDPDYDVKIDGHRDQLLVGFGMRF
jgi:outer membrane immunogenic protein